MQDKFLLLRSYLQARLTHLTCTMPWLSPHIAAAERQVLLAAPLLVDHPPPTDLLRPGARKTSCLIFLGGLS
jgi:hypothetical protein